MSKKRVIPQEEKNANVLEYMRNISVIPKYTPTSTTVNEWMQFWMQNCTANIRHSTRSSYEAAINNHINRVLGNIKLEELTTDDIQLFINSLIIGYQIPDSLQAKTIHNIHGVLHKALSVAVARNYILKNPADAVILPKIERELPKPLNDKQLSELLNRIANHPKKNLILFALYTGLRESEIIALTWNCFNADEKTLLVYRQLTKNKKTKKYYFSGVKNSKSRTLTLPDIAVQILLDIQSSLSSYSDDGFIFTNKFNSFYTPAAVYNSFKKIMKSIGYPDTRFHDLRHTYAVLSLKAGVDVKTLQYNMGHYSAAFTLDVYGHCLNEMRVHGAEKLNTYLAKFNE